MAQSADVCGSSGFRQLQGLPLRKSFFESSGLTHPVQLSPFVTNAMEWTKGRFEGGDDKGPMSGTRYLENWKEKNGVD